MNDITNYPIFAPLEAFIRSDEYTDADLFIQIADMTKQSARIGEAALRHAADIIQEHGTKDMTYTDITVQVFYRTFFSPEHAGKYGTDHWVHDQKRLEQFVQYMIDPATVTDVLDASPSLFPLH